MRTSVLVAALCLAANCASAEVKPLPKASWPKTVATAVPHILAALSPAQPSIVKGTAREDLALLQGEWGEDIEFLLGLEDGNAVLLSAVCPTSCTKGYATLLLMQAAWDALVGTK